MTEVPDIFRPSEWLTEAVPHKTPYYPQMGDEVVYFRQGHQAYIDAIRRKKVYDLGPRSEPWAKINLRVNTKFRSTFFLSIDILENIIVVE